MGRKTRRQSVRDEPSAQPLVVRPPVSTQSGWDLSMPLPANSTLPQRICLKMQHDHPQPPPSFPFVSCHSQGGVTSSNKKQASHMTVERQRRVTFPCRRLEGWLHATGLAVLVQEWNPCGSLLWWPSGCGFWPPPCAACLAQREWGQVAERWRQKPSPLSAVPGERAVDGLFHTSLKPSGRY